MTEKTKAKILIRGYAMVLLFVISNSHAPDPIRYALYLFPIGLYALLEYSDF